MKFTSKVLLVITLASGLSTANAAIVTLGGTASAPASLPTFNVVPGGSLDIGVWAQAQGTGRINTLSVGVYQSSAASFAGGVVSAVNALPAASLFTSSSFSYNANAAGGYFGNGTGVTNTTAVTGASVVIGNIGGSSVTLTPTAPITSGSASIVGILSGTVTATPGTYYLYLGRTGSGVIETPAFKAATFIGGQGTGASVTSTTVFGFGDAAVGTGGSGSNGTVANTLSTNADAIIIVQAAQTTTKSITLITGTDGVGINVSIPGSQVLGFSKVSVDVIGDSAQTKSTYDLIFGGAPGNAVVGLNIAGSDLLASDISSFGLLPVAGSPLAGVLAGYTYYKDTVISGSIANFAYDFTGTNIRVSSFAVIPEPSALGMLAVAGLPLLRRRRRA